MLLSISLSSGICRYRRTVTKIERRAAISIELVRRLSQERQRRGLSLNKLAAAAGLSQSMLSRLESDPQNPTLDSLLRIADELEVNLGNLLRGALQAVPKASAAKKNAV